jgi:hypothetical protein
LHSLPSVSNQPAGQKCFFQTGAKINPGQEMLSNSKRGNIYIYIYILIEEYLI